MTKIGHKIAKNGTFQKTRLRNGLRVISEQIPGVRSISLGVWVDVGSRYERTNENGLSHFVEHLVFKGTQHRNAKQIAASLESLGGALNAFTSREHTCYTARVLDEFLPEAVDVLADITCRPTLTANNMNRERQVIIEEIKESLDNPADHIHDFFADTHWGGHALGRPIMGTEEIIRTVPRVRLKKYRERNYCAGSIVIAASGSLSHQKLVRLVRDKFELPSGEIEPAQPQIRPYGTHVAIKTEDTSQTQFCLGFPGLPYDQPDRMALVLLTSHLGGGMSSVLFQKIREQRGLAYSVFAYHDFYRDGGVFGIYMGTDHTRVRQAYELVIDECRRLKKRKLSSNIMDKIKAQVKGHLTLGMESTTARMQRLGRLELLTQRFHGLNESLKAIDQVTATDLTRVARQLFDEDQITLVALGPVDPNLFDDVNSKPKVKD
ncbi:MAG: insulinase family protein [candidate division Zixibacteria bacterium]|nr:insulinase family protein [candidate division Zixibacteria bacterium]